MKLVGILSDLVLWFVPSVSHYQVGRGVQRALGEGSSLVPPLEEGYGEDTEVTTLSYIIRVRVRVRVRVFE